MSEEGEGEEGTVAWLLCVVLCCVVLWGVCAAYACCGCGCGCVAQSQAYLLACVWNTS